MCYVCVVVGGSFSVGRHSRGCAVRLSRGVRAVMSWLFAWWAVRCIGLSL